MKTIYFNEETIVAFHVGRGGQFNNQGHLTFVGENKIGDFIEDLFWDTDDKGNALPDAELRKETGNLVGCTWKEVESGIGRIDIDGDYNTTYTMKLSDVEQDSKEWNAIFKAHGYDAEQAQMFLRQELAIDKLQELADYINAHNDWEYSVNDIIEKNGWTDQTDEDYGVCESCDGFTRVVLNENGDAEVIEEE